MLFIYAFNGNKLEQLEPQNDEKAEFPISHKNGVFHSLAQCVMRQNYTWYAVELETII